MAEFIGNCVIWATCAAALAGACWVATWALDRTLSDVCFGLTWMQWAISRRPLTTAVQVQGLRFWRWLPQARRYKEEQIEERSRLTRLECEVRSLLAGRDYSEIPYGCRLLSDLWREAEAAAPAGASESEGGAS